MLYIAALRASDPASEVQWIGNGQNTKNLRSYYEMARIYNSKLVITFVKCQRPTYDSNGGPSVSMPVALLVLSCGSGYFAGPCLPWQLRTPLFLIRVR